MATSGINTTYAIMLVLIRGCWRFDTSVGRRFTIAVGAFVTCKKVEGSGRKHGGGFVVRTIVHPWRKGYSCRHQQKPELNRWLPRSSG